MIILAAIAGDPAPVNPLPVVAVVIASLSAACAITGVVFTAISTARAKRAEVLAKKSEKRAKRAEKRAIAADRQAEERRQFALWADAIAAMHEMVTFHAMSPEIQLKLQNLRIAFTELTDGLGQTLYPKLDEYLAGIHGATALMYERSTAQIHAYELGGRKATVDEIMESHEPIIQWLTANIGNFRLLRKVGPGATSNDWIRQGLENASETYQNLHKIRSTGWV